MPVKIIAETGELAFILFAIFTVIAALIFVMGRRIAGAVDKINEAFNRRFLRPEPEADTCDICGAPMETLIGAATWQDSTKCSECGFSPDDAWRVG